MTSDALTRVDPDPRGRAVHRAAGRPGRPHRRGRQPAAAAAARRPARRRRRGPAAHRHDDPAAGARHGPAARPPRSPSRATPTCRSPASAASTRSTRRTGAACEEAEQELAAQGMHRAGAGPAGPRGRPAEADRLRGEPDRGDHRPLRRDQPGRVRRAHRGPRRCLGLPEQRRCGTPTPGSTCRPAQQSVSGAGALAFVRQRHGLRGRRPGPHRPPAGLRRRAGAAAAGRRHAGRRRPAEPAGAASSAGTWCWTGAGTSTRPSPSCAGSPATTWSSGPSRPAGSTCRPRSTGSPSRSTRTRCASSSPRCWTRRRWPSPPAVGRRAGRHRGRAGDPAGDRHPDGPGRDRRRPRRAAEPPASRVITADGIPCVD